MIVLDLRVLADVFAIRLPQIIIWLPCLTCRIVICPPEEFHDLAEIHCLTVLAVDCVINQSDYQIYHNIKFYRLEMSAWRADSWANRTMVSRCSFCSRVIAKSLRVSNAPINRCAIFVFPYVCRNSASYSDKQT